MHCYCKSCGSTGVPGKKMRWPAAIEIILFLMSFCSLAVVADAIRDCKASDYSERSRVMFGETIMVFIVLVIATIVYGAFRRSMGFTICQACGSREIIPSDSPVAKQLMQQ